MRAKIVDSIKLSIRNWWSAVTAIALLTFGLNPVPCPIGSAGHSRLRPSVGMADRLSPVPKASGETLCEQDKEEKYGNHPSQMLHRVYPSTGFIHGCSMIVYPPVSPLPLLEIPIRLEVMHRSRRRSPPGRARAPLHGSGPQGPERTSAPSHSGSRGARQPW